jgi:hypothetical protein
VSAPGDAAAELVAQRVSQADPDLASETVTAAIAAVVTNRAVLRGLARALQGGPAALHAGAPPSVGRLVIELRGRGSILPEPACVRCGRTDRPLTASAEGGVCPRCRRRQAATTCSRCGGVKPVAGRDDHGQALCAACAPRPRRPCSACGQVRIVARRAQGSDGDLCDRCYRGPVVTCGACGRAKPCNFVAQGRPRCRACSPRRRMACAHCGQIRPPCAQWAEGPVCEPCYRAALGRRGPCGGCGAERRLVSPPGPTANRCAACAAVAPLAACRSCGVEDRPYANGCCVRCALRQRTRQLVGPPEGPLEPLYAAIVAAPQPYSAHNWLRSAASSKILAKLRAQEVALTHAALDACSPRQAAEFLRHLLVANGVLAPRDEGLVRLETWVRARLETIDDAERRRLLRSYATWRLLHRARQRAAGSPRTHTPMAHAKTYLNAAIRFLAFLDDRGRALGDCTQGDVDAWVSEGVPSPHEVSDFLGWAADRKLVAPVVIAGPTTHHGTALDDDSRWSMVQRLLHDEGLELTDRVAGCLVLVYGQQLARIVAITRDQLTVVDDVARLHLGATHIELPDPLGGLSVRLASEGRRYTGVGSPVTPWLFPGLSPGRPLGASRLGERLRRLGIPTMAARRGALVHLGAHLPAAVLADLLGIAPSTAVRWVRAAGGDWTTYAAQVVKER